MMNGHQPNRDMLSAYADRVLSPDAVRSMEQHLAQCQVCTQALELERKFLEQLDTLAKVTPPEDFVNAVMGRVAQHPVYRPGKVIPWRAAMRYGVAAAVVLAVVLGGGVTWMLGSGTLQNAEPGAVLAVVISSTAGMVVSVFATTRHLISQSFVLVEAAAQLMWRVTLLAASAGWMIQITLLLLTIGLNYAFTRLVLDYQRRN